MRVVFSREPGGAVTSASLDLMPVTMYRRPEARNPRRWATGILGAAGVGAATAFAVRRLRGTH